MPHLFSDIPDKLRVLLSQAANIFLAVVMIYIFQYIFNSEFSCSCTEEFHYIVVIYIGLIPLILFFILKIIKQIRTKVCGACCCGFWSQIFQLLGIYLFWGGFVLLDGDLYLCMATKHNDTLRKIPCKRKHTLEEKSMMTIYKNKSQLYGYICIAIGFFGWWLISNTNMGVYCDSCYYQCLKDCCCKICENPPSCKSLIDCCCKICKVKPYYKRRYEEFLFEETDKHLNEKLQNMAKKRAESICSEHIDSIEKSEFSKNTTIQMSEKARNSWSKISRSAFYKSDLPKDVNHEDMAADRICRIL